MKGRAIMEKERLCFGENGLDGIDIPESENAFMTDMCFFGGMTQEEIEAEADREEAECNQFT